MLIYFLNANPTSERLPFPLTAYADRLLEMREEGSEDFKSERKFFDKIFNSTFIDICDRETLLLALQASEWHGWTSTYSSHQEKLFQAAQTLDELKDILFEEASIMAEKRRFSKMITRVATPEVSQTFENIPREYLTDPTDDPTNPKKPTLSVDEVITTKNTIAELIRTQEIPGLSRDIEYQIEEDEASTGSFVKQLYRIYEEGHLIYVVKVGTETPEQQNLISALQRWPWGDISATIDNKEFTLGLAWYTRLFTVQGPDGEERIDDSQDVPTVKKGTFCHDITFMQPATGISLYELNQEDPKTKDIYYAFGVLFGTLIRYDQGSQPLFHQGSIIAKYQGQEIDFGHGDLPFKTSFIYDPHGNNIKFDRSTNSFELIDLEQLGIEQTESVPSMFENNHLTMLYETFKAIVFDQDGYYHLGVFESFIEGFISNWSEPERQKLKEFLLEKMSIFYTTIQKLGAQPIILEDSEE